MLGPNSPPDRCGMTCPRSTVEPSTRGASRKATLIGRVAFGHSGGREGPRSDDPVLLRQARRTGEVKEIRRTRLLELVQGGASGVAGLIARRERRDQRGS